MSTASKTERKFAAIMFTDIVGFTELSSIDEESALKLLDKKRDLIVPLISKYKGALIKEMGDGTLSQYNELKNAIECAHTFQSKTDRDLQVRAGIHSGEVIFKNEDVFGDVVNIANRLESIAKPRSVLVSKETIDNLENKEGLEFVPLGLQSLKGVGRLIEVYALKSKNLYTPKANEYEKNKIETHSDNEVPSIGIIPFRNKGAKEDVFYAYGISADLITDCSGAGLIRVATLASIEKLKNYDELKTEDLASKLMVRYIAEGTLWKMGDMFQLSIELYDTKKDKVVWSDMWQEEWDNLPTIKGNLSDGLLKALDTKPISQKNVETTSPEAYEFYLKAKHKYFKRETTDDTEMARELLYKAMELDGSLIIAKTLLALTFKDIGEYDKAMEIYSEALTQAESLDDKRGIGISLNGVAVIHYNKGDYDQSLEYLDRSRKINEELGDKHGISTSLNERGIVYWNKSEYEKALASLKRSLEISEELGNKHGTASSLNNIGCVHWDQDNLDKALIYFQRSLEVSEELGNKLGIGNGLNNIGIIYKDKGDLNKALDYYTQTLKIREEIGDKRGLGDSYNNLGTVFKDMGFYDKALEHFERSLKFREEIGDKSGEGRILYNIGSLYFVQNDLQNSCNYLEKSLKIRKEIDQDELELETIILLYINYKSVGKDYDVKHLHKLIEDSEDLGSEFNFRLYEFLENKNYLEKAYHQVQKNVGNMEELLKEEYVNYPVPKMILEEYKKIFH